MAYRELVKNGRVTAEKVTSVTYEVVIHIVCFLGGLLLSKGAVLSDLSPFGSSFIAAIPFSYMPSGLFGTIVGYLLRNPVESFRYIAVAISIAALRWVLNEFRQVSGSRYFPSVVSFIPMFLTGVALTFSGESELTLLSTCLMEATLASVAAYFISRTMAVLLGKKSIYNLSNQEIACVAMSGCIFLLAFSSLMIGYMSVGRTLAVIVVLIAARYGGVSGGCIAGVATGVVFSLQSPDYMFLCAGFAFSGLMGGLFAPLRKFSVAGAVLVCNMTMAFSANTKEVILSVLLENIIAITIFMFLPKSLGNYVRNIFDRNDDIYDNDALRQAIVMRLSFASKAISGVSSCVDKVSEKLSRGYDSDINWVYNSASKETCSHCGLRYFCLERQKEQTQADFAKLREMLIYNGQITVKDVEENFSKKCCRTKELVSAVNNSYNEYRQSLSAQQRITQIRTVVGGQFSGLSQILEDMAEEYSEYEKFEPQLSDRVKEVLTSLSLTVIDCSCRISKGKGMIVEAQLLLNTKTNVSKSLVSNEVSRVCGRRFESPQVTFELDRAKILLCERPNYDVQIGSSQHVCNNSDLCGDCLTYFNNGQGNMVVILSDGMGTGGRAAVDSNMATSIISKLIKAGLSYDCALSVVNSSLMIKSEDESMATLDVLDINLFSGKVDVMKAGACTTYIKKKSKIIRKDLQSLPIGILSDVQFSKESITLSEGDMILMVSDGALVTDDLWIERIMEDSRDKTCEEIAQSVVTEAKKRRNDGHDDDITAIALRVIEN